MTKKLLNSRVLLMVISLMFTFTAYSQLPAFNFTVTATDQTCLNNGVLHFTVSGIQPGAGVTYAVYLLPNTTSAEITTTNTTVPGRAAGNYTIIATQSLNGQTSTNTQNITIHDLITPLTYGVGFSSVRCGNDGRITATVTSGYPSTYEILTGPVTRAPQASNVFAGLPPGLYSVRVTDTCGEAVVKSITVLQATTGLIIGDMELSSGQLPGCNIIGVGNLFSTVVGGEIFFPLTIQYTVFPPGGGTPIVTTLPNYMADSFAANIPFYNNQQYSYTLRVTDACGNVVTKNNVINGGFSVDVAGSVESCGFNVFTITPHYFMLPCTVVFNSFPAGFNPGALNIFHPTFIEDPFKYGGNGAYAPEGNYTVTVTDNCGRTSTVNFELVDPPPPPPIVAVQEVFCGSDGTISIKLNGVKIVSVTLTGAPAAYGPTPVDVSDGINSDGEFAMIDIPAGTYIFVVVDECGNSHDVSALVGAGNANSDLSVQQRPGCVAGYGTVKITHPAKIVNLIITAAPTAFTETLPFTANSNIATDGAFYMNSLPAGSYTVRATTFCGTIITKNIIVLGYTELVNNLTVTPHCGSFDIKVEHASNGNYVAGLYLQRFDPISGTWGHPQTGMAYVEGGQANALNSIGLTNNVTSLTLAYTGDFRVLKTFFVFDNGTILNIRCVEVLHTFSFGDGPRIIDAFSFPCVAGLNEVAVIAEGVPPLSYSITTKEGLPFALNNGQSNLFSGLESATYNFRVTDVCGNIRNIVLDIDALDPVGIKAEGFCEGQDSRLFVQEFSFLQYKWYKQGAPGTVLSTTGTLNFPDYDSATDAGIYHVSITSNNPLSCMNQELNFPLLINALPDAGDDITAQLCNNGESINLREFLADDIIATGAWEDTDATGLLTNSTLSVATLPEGIYHFKYTVAGLCNLSDESMLTLEVKDIPQLPVISSDSPHCEGSDIQFSATTVPGAVYQWSGPNGFVSTEQSPLLSGVSVNAAGTYALTVIVNGCSSSSAQLAVAVNAAPKAGDDTNVPLCNEGNTIDLEDYLSGVFDAGGIWEDVNAAGGFSGSTLNTAGIAQGTYQFRYTVENICNVTDEAVISVQLKDIPQAPVLNPVLPVCEGTDVQLSAETIANAAYQWTGPSGFVSNLQNPLISGTTPLLSGDYAVTVTVNDCISATAVVPVTVNAFPQFEVEGNTVLCEGQTTSLKVILGNFASATYKWYFDGNVIAGETSADLSISQIGNYEVEVDNNSCVTSREIAVSLNENPFEVELESGCRNYDYMLWVANISEIAGATVTWTGPGNFNFTGPEANITNLAEGEYTATITNDEGCAAVASITVDNTSCIIPKGVSPNGDGYNDSFDLSNLDVIELKIFNRYGLKVYEAQNYLKEWHGQSDKGTLPTGTYYYVITLSAGKQASGWVYLQREE
ncbi:T9SS type B sorting domain-containing protein [Flavobacterium hauense]